MRDKILIVKSSLGPIVIIVISIYYTHESLRLPNLSLEVVN